MSEFKKLVKDTVCDLLLCINDTGDPKLKLDYSKTLKNVIEAVECIYDIKDFDEVEDDEEDDEEWFDPVGKYDDNLHVLKRTDGSGYLGYDDYDNLKIVPSFSEEYVYTFFGYRDEASRDLADSDLNFDVDDFYMVPLDEAKNEFDEDDNFDSDCWVIKRVSDGWFLGENSKRDNDIWFCKLVESARKFKRKCDASRCLNSRGLYQGKFRSVVINTKDCE